jgi:hypothetical protein
MMRTLTLLWLCLVLAGCGAGTRLAGDPAPIAARTVPAPAEADDPAPAAPATAPTGGARDLTEAKVICWGKVEREKQRVRNIDQRIAYVERCVAEQMKGN